MQRILNKPEQKSQVEGIQVLDNSCQRVKTFLSEEIGKAVSLFGFLHGFLHGFLPDFFQSGERVKPGLGVMLG